MVIAKGEPWGRRMEAGDGDPEMLPVAENDAALAGLAADGVSPIRLIGGDLLTTIGGSTIDGSGHNLLPVDLGWVVLDDGPRMPFSAHVVARRWGWQGPSAVVMNAAWLGDLYLGPKSHPNDGLLDVTSGSLPLRQRLLARKRAHSGRHVPHPALSTWRSASWDHEFATSTPVRIDGVLAGRARALHVEIQPDAVLVVT